MHNSKLDSDKENNNTYKTTQCLKNSCFYYTLQYNYGHSYV